MARRRDPGRTAALLLLALAAALSLRAEELPVPAVIAPAFRMPTGGRITTRPLADGEGLIAVASEDRYLYRLDREGRIVAREDLPGMPGPHAAVGGDDTVYLGLTSGVLIALRPGGGILWRRRLGSPLAADPALALDGRIFVVGEDGVLHALDHRGDELWSESLEGGFGGQPLIDERGVLYVPDGRNFLTAWLPWGVPLWRFLLAGRAVTGLAARGTLLIATDEGTLAEIDSEGRLRRSTVLGGRTPFLVRNGGLTLAAGGSSLAALDPDGEVLWSSDTGLGNAAGLFAFDEGGLLVDTAGRCLQFDADGETLQRYSLGGPAGRPNLLPDGLLVGGGDDWNIYAASAPAPAAGVWSVPGADRRGAWNGGAVDGKSAFAPWLRDPDYLLLSALLERDGELSRAEALELIRERLKGAGRERRYPPYYLAFAAGIAGELYENPRLENGRVVNDYPELRRAAVELLAERGAWESASALRRVVGEEWSLDTVAAAMRGLGRIGADPWGRSTRAITARLLTGNTLTARPALTETGLAALYGILEYHGSAPDRSLYEAALEAYGKSNSSAVRAAALKLLRYEAR